MKQNWTVSLEAVMGLALVVGMGLCACEYAQGGRSDIRLSNSASVFTANSGTHEYYVAVSGNDSNDGSQTRPWRTIGHAARLVTPGDTVHVLPGVYSESVYLFQGGTASQRVRLISDTPWGARVTGDGSGNPAIQIRKADYVDVVGFEVTNVGGYMGIETLSSYSHIVGNLVHDVSGGCKLGRFTLGGAGINLVGPGHDVDVIGNVVHDVGDHLNPHGCENTHGIYVENARSPNAGGYSTRAWNNIIYRNESEGITSWHCATQMVLVNNLAFENGKTGILVGANDPGCINDNSIVNNNILAHNGWHDFCTFTSASQCPIGNHSGKGGIQEGGSTGRNNTYSNNLSFQNQFIGKQDDAVHLSTGSQSNNISGIDPQFVNYQPDGTGDYHLQASSPAINKGTNADAPPYDFDNYSRPYGPSHDIGPYEWHPGSTAGTLKIPTNLASASAPSEVPTEAGKSRPDNEDLAKFAGLFVSENPPAKIRIRIESGRLIATMLSERGQPSYPLAQVSPTRFRFEGAPPGFNATFSLEGNRVKSVTVERGPFPAVHLVPGQ